MNYESLNDLISQEKVRQNQPLFIPQSQIPLINPITPITPVILQPRLQPQLQPQLQTQFQPQLQTQFQQFQPPFQPQFQPQFQPPFQQFQHPFQQFQPPFQPRDFISMNGMNPIRGMYTSVYPNLCAQYGSSNIQVNPRDYYMGSEWCSVGILTHHSNMLSLESRWIANEWQHRVRDPITHLYINIDSGNGPYRSFRTNDTLNIPGKNGTWTIQIQQDHPYLLYLPV